jgi:hypothetical protein
MSALIPTGNLASNFAWYALYTHHQHEKAVAQALAARSFEAFLPVYSKPQAYPVFGRTTRLDVLSHAEDLADDAGNSAVITRSDFAAQALEQKGKCLDSAKQGTLWKFVMVLRRADLEKHA